MAKLAQDIEKEKAEIAQMEGGKEKEKEKDANQLVKGFQGLPNSISSILFGSKEQSEQQKQQQQPTSTLSKMSDGKQVLSCSTVFPAFIYVHFASSTQS